MFRKFISIALILVVLSTGRGALAVSKEKTQGRAEKVEQIRRKVLTRGTGAKARASVKLNDGTKLKGYISEATADSFTLIRTDTRQAAPLKISYDDVAELKAHGKGMSTTSKVLIGTGIGVGVTVGVLALMLRNFRLKIR